MDSVSANIILYSAFVILMIIGFATLVIVYRVYKMHDVKRDDGEYAWMVPYDWASFQKSIMESQERIVVKMAEASENHLKESQLLESLTNATLAMYGSINGGCDGRK